LTDRTASPNGNRFAASDIAEIGSHVVGHYISIAIHHCPEASLSDFSWIVLRTLTDFRIR
jgi:hypothetical protein